MFSLEVFAVICIAMILIGLYWRGKEHDGTGKSATEKTKKHSGEASR